MPARAGHAQPGRPHRFRCFRCFQWNKAPGSGSVRQCAPVVLGVRATCHAAPHPTPPPPSRNACHRPPCYGTTAYLLPYCSEEHLGVPRSSKAVDSQQVAGSLGGTPRGCWVGERHKSLALNRLGSKGRLGQYIGGRRAVRHRRGMAGVGEGLGKPLRIQLGRAGERGVDLRSAPHPNSARPKERSRSIAAG